MNAFTLSAIDRLRYRPTKAAEEFLGDLRSSLGLPDKATAARLAIARSVAEVDASRRAVAIPVGAELGLAIEGVHLFGDDADLWACLIADTSDQTVKDSNAFRSLVEGHWHRGATLLQNDYVEAGRNDVEFIARLSALLPKAGGISSSGRGRAAPSVTRGVVLRLLEDEEPWTMNAPGGNGLMVVSGRPGSGKSQLALDLLLQVARQGVRFLFFDLKGELEDDPHDRQQREKRDGFLRETGATYVRLIDDGLPINPFFRGATSPETAQIASEIAHLVRCFASQMGALQERAIRDAYEHLVSPDLSGLADELRNGGSDGVSLATIEKLESFEVFSDANSAVPIDQWLGQSWVIDFKKLGNDTDSKALIVAFVLNAIMKQMNRNLPVENGVQPLQMVLFVDEAHLLLPKEGKAGLLGSLARQGRSWGFPVWLASQDADAFITSGQNETDFSQLADCGVHLSPSTLTDNLQKRIFGQVVHRRLDAGEGVLRLRGKTTIGKIRQYWRDRGEIRAIS